jgi:hypothetical protein
MFDFFDISKTGFIEKEDFIKMLYNYSKRDILRILYKIETSKSIAGKKISKTASIEMSSQREIGLQSSKNIHKELKSLNIEEMKKFSKARLQSRKLESSRKIKHQSMEIKFGKQYHTTMNHSIKFIADLVYQEIGQGEGKEQMSYKSFEHWVKTNNGILETFDKWLRKEFWTFDKMKGCLQYRSDELVIGDYMKVNMRTKKEILKIYKKNFVELYNEILIIYKDSSGKELVRIIILNNMEIKFIENELKIKLMFPESARYKNVTLVLSSKELFFKWKKNLEPFLIETVEQFYKFSDKIGRGTYSTVNKGVCRINPDAKVAIKTIIKENLKPDEKALISEESLIMKKLDHINIIKFIKQYEDTKRLYYVFELVEGGDLYDHITKEGRITEEESKVIFLQLLNVIKYLHDNHILHRDLKPENIMIILNDISGKIDSIKLIDFGFATYFSTDELPSLSCGTLNYAAPEVLLGEKYGPPSDLFSAGVILYLM